MKIRMRKSLSDLDHVAGGTVMTPPWKESFWDFLKRVLFRIHPRYEYRILHVYGDQTQEQVEAEDDQEHYSTWEDTARYHRQAYQRNLGTAEKNKKLEAAGDNHRWPIPKLVIQRRKVKDWEDLSV